MARSCGIHLGPERFEIVVLDGNTKKQSLVAARAGELAGTPDERAGILKDALRDLKLSKENVGLVVDAGKAAFRHVTLPLTDRAKIDQVLKFEVEKDLPQWDVDEVVMDYLMTSESDVTSDLLVTAVRKDEIAAYLDLCEKAGLEPLEAELDATAIVNAAIHSDLCPEGEACLLVHVGDESTAAVVVDGGHVVAIRGLHIGALGTPKVADAVVDSPTEGALLSEADREGGHSEHSDHQKAALRRISRELGRSISAIRTKSTIERIFVCGASIPGLVGSEIHDVPVEALHAFGPEDSTVEAALPEGEPGQWVAAYGAALRELGAAELSPSLRREELKYAGTWERIEFPIAVACLLLATLMAVGFILQRKELDVLNNYGAGLWHSWSNGYMMGNPRKGQRGNLSPPPETIRDFLADVEGGALDPDGIPWAKSYLASTKRIDALLRREVADLKKELGADSSVEQPQSALVGSYLVLDLFEKHQKDWRPSLRHVEAITQGMGKAGKSESVRVTLTFVLMAESAQAASSNYEALLTALKEQPWHLSSTRTNLTSLDNDKGLLIERMPIDVDVSVFYEQQRREALEAAQ